MARPIMSNENTLADEPGPASLKTSPTGVEWGLSIAIGGGLMAMALSLWVWGTQLAVAGLLAPQWPPGLLGLLLPIGLLAAGVGFGAWRMLAIVLPERLLGLGSGSWVLVAFGVAALAGTLNVWLS